MRTLVPQEILHDPFERHLGEFFFALPLFPPSLVEGAESG